MVSQQNQNGQRLNQKMNRSIKKDSTNHLNYKLGRMLPPIAIYGGYLFILIGLFSIIFGNPFLGAGIIILGILVSFTHRGVILDIQERKITTYTSILLVKRDKIVNNLDDYNVITVNRSSMRYRSYSWMSKSSSFTNYYFTVFLSKDTSKNRIPIATFKDKNRAMAEARKLEKLFNLRFQVTRI